MPDPIVGDENNNVLLGTAEGETISGLGGHDWIFGGGGNDTLLGGDGFDTAAYGAWVLLGGYPGGAPAVQIVANFSFSVAADGTVTVSDINTANGDEGSDTLTGFEALAFGAVTSGGYEYRLATGTAGDDSVLQALSGTFNLVLGGDGNDTITDGSEFADVLIGGSGTDTISFDGATANVWASLLLERRSNDVQFFVDANGAVVPDVQGAVLNGQGTPTASGQSVPLAYDVIMEFENLIGGEANDWLQGDDTANVINGGAGHDTIEGLGGDDDLDGGNGTNNVSYQSDSAGVTVNLLTGSATGIAVGTDQLANFAGAIGGTGNDHVTGNTGANRLAGGAGDDTLIGGGGNDTLIGDTGTDTMSGGNGDDTYHVTDMSDVVHEASGEGTDVVISSSDFTLGAGEEVEELRVADDASGLTLTGNERNDHIFGGTFGNTLVGGGGDDTITGEGGFDVLDGGEGDMDRAVFVSAHVADFGNRAEGTLKGFRFGFDEEGDVQVIDIDTSNDEDDGSVSVRQIERLVFGDVDFALTAGSDGDDTIDVLSLPIRQVVVAGELDDTIIDAAGTADAIDGGTGNDTLSFAPKTGNVFAELSEIASLTVNGDVSVALIDGVAADAFKNIENLIGGSGEDTLRGNHLANTLSGGGGDDRLLGRSGDDDIDGGAGDSDVAEYEGPAPGTTDAPGAIVARYEFTQLSSTSLSVVDGTAEEGADTLSDIELLDVGGYVYRIVMGIPALASDVSIASLVLGGAGNDTLIDGNDYADIFDGSSGTDTVSFAGRLASVEADLSAQRTFSGGVAYDVLLGFENLIGGFGDDTLTGDDSGNVLTGGGGDDTLGGGGGVDTAVYSSAIDHNGGYVLSLADNGQISVSSAANGTLEGIDQLLDFEEGELLRFGTETFALIRANSPFASSTFSGLVGNQIILGGSNTDIVAYTSPFFGGDGIGVSLYDNGMVSVETGPSDVDEGTDYLFEIERLVFDGDTFQLVLGTKLANVLAGEDFRSDLILGGSGNDTVNVTTGSLVGFDLMGGGAGTDTLSFATRLGAVNANMDFDGEGLGRVMFGGEIKGYFGEFENLVGSNFADILTGNASANRIDGGASGDDLAGLDGNDYLDGGLGNDRLFGGLGNDTFVIDSIGDLLFEQGGIDTVQSSVTKILATGFENLTLTGTAAISGTGNTLANILIGNSGTNRLTGGTGRDTLTGGAGTSVRDIFDFNNVNETGKTASTRDKITDFRHLVDDIDLSTIDANGTAAGNAKFVLLAAKGAAFTGVKGQLHWFQQNASGTANDRTIIEGDVNGDKKADFQIELTGLKTLTAADFVL